MHFNGVFIALWRVYVFLLVSAGPCAHSRPPDESYYVLLVCFRPPYESYHTCKLI